MVTNLRPDTAVVVFALQRLMQAVVAHRPDAAELEARIRAKGSRILLDEPTGFLVFSTFMDDGEPLWIDTVCCDPRDLSTFGLTPAELTGAGRAN